jgi:threonine dehydratase
VNIPRKDRCNPVRILPTHSTHRTHPALDGSRLVTVESRISDAAPLRERRAALEAARARCAPFIHRTPLERSRVLSEAVGAQVYLKMETFQKTGSFKARGMVNKLALLASDPHTRGVITFAAGNAAQSIAYAAKCMSLPATVVMTPGASPSKVAAARSYGATVVIADSARDLEPKTIDIMRREGLTLVHPCDDLDVMSGHASLAFEVLEDLPDTSAIVTAIGGGGLAGALSLASGARERSPRLIGVEPRAAAHMHRSLQAGSTIEPGATTTRGLCSPITGRLCYELVRQRFERIVLVSEAQIIESMRMLMRFAKLIVEPSGAAALAGALAGRIPFSPQEKVVVIVSGGNVDLERLKALL